MAKAEQQIENIPFFCNRFRCSMTSATCITRQISCEKQMAKRNLQGYGYKGIARMPYLECAECDDGRALRGLPSLKKQSEPQPIPVKPFLCQHCGQTDPSAFRPDGKGSMKKSTCYNCEKAAARESSKKYNEKRRQLTAQLKAADLRRCKN